MKVTIGEIYRNRVTIFTADENITGKSFPVKEANIEDIQKVKTPLTHEEKEIWSSRILGK